MKLKWLDGQPNQSTGVTWGVPWKKGLLDRNESVILSDSEGGKVGVQTWPTAYWPDGSVKWTGHAAVLKGDSSKYYKLEVGENEQVHHAIEVKESEDFIQVDTGRLT